MTRPAFKQASGSPENESQQKKLDFSKQKQEGLSNKKPRLSKTDNKLQEEEEQQQQYKEDVEEVRRKMLRREALIERNKEFLRRRQLTAEEAESYSKKFTESAVDTRPVCGFDVVDLPSNIDSSRPVEQSNEADLI